MTRANKPVQRPAKDASSAAKSHGAYLDGTQESEAQFAERFDLVLWATSTEVWDWDIERKLLWSKSRKQPLHGEGDTETTRHFDIDDAEEVWAKRLHPEDRERVLQSIRAHLDHNDPFDVEYRQRQLNDDYMWVRSVGRAVRDADGSPVRMVGTHSDITTQKLAEIEKQQLRDAVDSASEGIVLFDADERFVYANKRYRELFPRIGQFLVPGTPRDNIRRAYFAIGAMTATVGSVDDYILEVRQHIDAGEASEVCLTNGTWLKRSDHVLPTGYAVSIRTDITAMKEREEALGASEKRYRSLVEDQPEFVCRYKPDGSLLFSNAAYAKQCGFDLEDISGINIFDFVPPEEVAALKRYVASLGPDKPFATVEHRLDLQDGSVRWQEWSDRAFFDESGRVFEFQAFGRDVTDRKIAEEELRKNEASLTEAQETANVGSWSLEIEDQNQMRTLWSAQLCRIFGIEPDSVPQEFDAYMQYTHADDRELVGRRWTHSLKTGEPYDLEHRIVWPDGQIRHVHTRARAMKDQFHHTTRWSGARVDITYRIEAEREILEAKERAEFADQQKSEFLANMSHELRTPLNAILGFSQMMETEIFGPLGDAHYEGYVTDILYSGRHLLSLIDDILDLSRIEAGKAEFHETEVDLGTTIERCTHMMTVNIRQAELVLDVELGTELPLLRGDARALDQIVLNLLSNALKFTPAGGRITVAARLSDTGCLALSVRDTGVGIKSSDIPRVLSRFGRVNSADNRKIAGTGLGLQLVDALAQLHDGELKLDSEFGVGTTVSVLFPKSRVIPLPSGLRKRPDGGAAG